MLTRDSILAAQDLPVKKVPVPEWDGHVYVRTLTAAERDGFEVACLNGGPIRASLVVRCCVDKEGVRLFADEDATELSGKSCAAIDRIFEKAEELNKISADDVKELEGN